MNSNIILALSTLSMLFLVLLCIAAVLFIINIAKTRMDHTLYFKADAHLYSLAFKDDLTHLFNRNAYIRDLGLLKRKKFKKLWFSIFDIDNFKTINDTKGHLFGDEILKAAANRLHKVFNDKNHTVYRIGGDEFLVISKDISENELVALLMELGKIELKNCDFRFSKGYSTVESNGSECFDIAFDNADKMLYTDKNSKKHKAFQTAKPEWHHNYS